MSEPVITAHCIEHGDDMFGCQVVVDGRTVAYLDGRMPRDKTLAQLEAEVVENRRRTMAEPEIVVPDYAGRIRDRRIERRISLRDVAKRLKIDVAAVSDLERGRATPDSYRFAMMWAMMSGLEHDEAAELFAVAELPR